MSCIKCGKKLKNQKVFCEDCLAQAENYPVDPDTPLALSIFTEEAPAKKRHARKRPALSPEEQLPRLRKMIRRLRLVILLLLILLSASILLIWNLLQQSDNARLLPALYCSQSDADQNVSRETFLDLAF